MRYLIEPKDRTYVKEYGFLSFAKSMGENSSKNMIKTFLIAQKNQQQIQ